MSKISKILVITLVLIISIKIVHAAGSIGKVFGGRILKTEATEITTTEAENYSCQMEGGTSIEVERIGTKEKTPTAFFIPANTKSKTGTVPMAKQLIIGRYSGTTSITCLSNEKYRGAKTVSLTNISMFGTSKN
jgi:hypothetical protein